MRLVVHGDSLGPDSQRLAHAAIGLAERGHAVAWVGGNAPSASSGSIQALPDVWTLARLEADLVLAADARPARTARIAWLARAHGAVFALTRAGVERWSAFERWAVQTLHPAGLVEEREGEAFARDPRGFEPDRLGLWPPPGGPADAASSPDTEVLERACERHLARRRGAVESPALFVDRDGTLVREVGYLADPDALEMLPGVIAALRVAAAARIPIVVISNQSGIGRGLYREAQVHATMARLRARLRDEGVELTSIYICPHRPDENCSCRKPRPGLLLRAAEDLRIDLKRSVMVGDKRIDVEAGQRAGARGVLVRTGYGGNEDGEKESEVSRKPDYVAQDLDDAVRWFLARETQ